MKKGSSPSTLGKASGAGKAPGQVPSSVGEDGASSKQMMSSQKKKRYYKIGPGMFRSTIKRVNNAALYRERDGGSKDDGPAQLSSVSLDVLCGIAYDIVERVVDVSRELVEKSHRSTIKASDVISAVHIMLGGELRKRTVEEINKALVVEGIESKDERRDVVRG